MKYTHVYVFNSQSLLPWTGQRALGPRGGGGRTQLPGAAASRWGWREGPSGARRQMRVSLRPGSPRPAVPDWRGRRSWVLGVPGSLRARRAPPHPPGGAAASCPAERRCPQMQTSGQTPSFLLTSRGWGRSRPGGRVWA